MHGEAVDIHEQRDHKSARDQPEHHEELTAQRARCRIELQCPHELCPRRASNAASTNANTTAARLASRASEMCLKASAAFVAAVNPLEPSSNVTIPDTPPIPAAAGRLSAAGPGIQRYGAQRCPCDRHRRQPSGCPRQPLPVHLATLRKTGGPDVEDVPGEVCQHDAAEAQHDDGSRTVRVDGNQLHAIGNEHSNHGTGAHQQNRSKNNTCRSHLRAARRPSTHAAR